MTKYLSNTPFSTSAPTTDDYRSRWEATFGKKVEETKRKPQSITEMVTEFHEVYGQPIVTTPTVPSPERVKLRLKLIAEEFAELCAASSTMHLGDLLIRYIDHAAMNVDLVETADALGDLMYVIVGMALELGIPLDKVLAEIHRSNLSKLGEDGKPVYSETGKVMKGPSYSPPDIAGVLDVAR